MAPLPSKDLPLPGKPSIETGEWRLRFGAVPSVRVNYRQHGLDEVAVEILKGQRNDTVTDK